MLAKLRHAWQVMLSSFWFVPTGMVVGAVGLAAILITADKTVNHQVEERWPLFFGAGAAGSRGLLTAVASSMITVAGVVFSITIVALSLTSSQYTSRILRNFMRDRTNQVVLGVFVGIFAYCLVVLRTIRGGDEGAFVPSLSVLVGLILAFVGIAFLIYFIHHVSMSIQASRIIEEAAQETIEAVDYLFPKALGDDDETTNGTLSSSLTEQEWSAVLARQSGYIQSIDGDGLLAWAREHVTVLRTVDGVGSFVVEGTPLVFVAGLTGLDDEMTSYLNAAYVISRQRTVQQDAAFGIRQIVDIALKALSPGINDSTTAVICVDYLTAILARLASRRIGTTHLLDEGELRVITHGPTFASLLADAFDQIRQTAGGNVAVLLRMPIALQTVASMTSSPSRLRAIQEQLQCIAEVGERTIASPHDRDRFESRLAQVREALAPFSSEPDSKSEYFKVRNHKTGARK